MALSIGQHVGVRRPAIEVVHHVFDHGTGSLAKAVVNGREELAIAHHLVQCQKPGILEFQLDLLLLDDLPCLSQHLISDPDLLLEGLKS